MKDSDWGKRAVLLSLGKSTTRYFPSSLQKSSKRLGWHCDCGHRPASFCLTSETCCLDSFDYHRNPVFNSSKGFRRFSFQVETWRRQLRLKAHGCWVLCWDHLAPGLLQNWETKHLLTSSWNSKASSFRETGERAEGVYRQNQRDTYFQKHYFWTAYM